MNEKSLLPGARKKLPIWFSAVWSSRAVALALNMAMAGYMSLYYTDVLGLNAAVMGILLMISKFSDAFTDLIVGYIVDRTHTKLGKARPYEISISLLWLCIFLMYSTPKMGTVATYAWILITYFLQTSVFITILYGTEPVYMVRAIKYPENRTKVTANAGIFQMIICTTVGMIIPQVMQRIGVDRHSWSLVALCLAIPCGTIGLLRFFLIPELPEKEMASDESAVSEEQIKKEDAPISLKESFRALKGNKYIWILALVYFTYHFANGISGGAGTYYTKYNIGDLGVQSWLNAASLFAFPVLIFVPKIMKKLGTGKTLRYGLVIMMLGPVIRQIGGTSLVTLIIGSLFMTAGSVPIAFMLNIYLFECMDYGEWKNGTRVEGMLGSITSFVAKVAGAIATGAMGMLLVAIGYKGTSAVQSGGTLFGLSALYNIVPALIVLAGLLISFRYDVEKHLPQIRKELNKEV
ncbi:MAG: MFS transporter [Bilifractor sp.]